MSNEISKNGNITYFKVGTIRFPNCNTKTLLFIYSDLRSATELLQDYKNCLGDAIIEAHNYNIRIPSKRLSQYNHELLQSLPEINFNNCVKIKGKNSCFT